MTNCCRSSHTAELSDYNNLFADIVPQIAGSSPLPIVKLIYMHSNHSRSRSTVRLESVYRKSLLLTIARTNGSILVNEYPKSGGTWLANMVSQGAGKEFPQNQFPTLRTSIFHGHYLKKFRGVATVVLWRDPRDVIVSWYHHSLTSNHTNKKLLTANRSALGLDDYSDIGANLPKFIKFMFEQQTSPSFNWNVFFDKWSADDANVIHTSYEKLSQEPATELSSIFKKLNINSVVPITEVVEQNSFKTQSGRKKGAENSSSFLRKGIVGDWKNVFNENAIVALENATEGRLEKYLQFIDKTNKL